MRIPLHASSFFFNDLVFLVIRRKSLIFLTPLFSIPTAPSNRTQLDRVVASFNNNGLFKKD
jgi:hypothetical protein